MIKILAIDNQKDNLASIKAVIKSNIPNCEVLTALSGKEGINIAKKEQPDTILLDIIMPNMDGYEVCKRLKEDESTKHIPVVMIMAIKTDSESHVKGLNAGADAFLSKPINTVKLSAQVKVMLRIKKAEDKLRAEKELLDKKIGEKTKDLRVSEERLINIFENSTNLFYSHTPDHVLTYLSPQIMDILGYTQEEALIKWTELASDNPINEIGFKHTINAIKTGKSQSPYELELVHKSGKKVWVEIREAPVVKDGKTVSIVGALIDITKRKQADQIQKVLYNISNAVSITDNLENLISCIKEELGTVIDTTNFYVALYNNKTDTLTLPFFTDEKDKFTSIPAGKTLTKYVTETKKPLLANINVKKRLVKEGMLEHIGSLSKIWLGVPLKIEGKITGVIAVQSYIDENAYNKSDMKMLEFVADQISISINRKKAEEKLQKYQDHLEEIVEERTAELSFANAELAKAADMKDEFLANMSHELRTPLNAILGLSEALQEEIYGSLNHKQIEKLHHIEESGRHLLDLINEILDLAKIEAGKIILDYQQISIENLLQSSLRFIKQTAFKKKIEVSSNISSTIETFRADEKRMKQILVNLLSNAVKFTPNEGQVGLDVYVNKETQTISFLVWDTGIGIPSKHFDKLFQPFVQIDSKLSRQYSGTGLGLALVNNLTNLHNGSITFESQEGKGSSFTVTIPIMEYGYKDSVPIITGSNRNEDESKINMNKSDVLIEEENVPVKKEDQKLILLAEDNEQNITNIKDYLEANQFRVIVARNGKDAVKMAHEINPELILMDIQMPKMSGLEAIKEIRAISNSNISDASIIALTALAMPNDKEKCLNAGADEYMKKPVGLKHLVKTINNLLVKKK